MRRARLPVRSARQQADRKCDGGTLFLDEIGEIASDSGQIVAGAGETGRFGRVGGYSRLKCDVRVIAATNRDLLAMSQEGTFRADLFYRLNGFTIYVPPLRQRSDDIPALVKHFINNHDFSRRVNKHLSEEALAKPVFYPSPGEYS